MRGKLVTILLLLLLLSASAGATRVMVVSDTHYMAKELYENSDLFLRALRAGDGKVTHHGDELMAALLDEVAREQPDALIVTGDLSFNGERASHEALAKWFAQIEAQGVPVWVLPGNHDINVPTARGFSGDGWYTTDPVTPEQFSAIYTDFMGPAEGGANLSYTVVVDDRLWIPMVDAAYYQGEAQVFGLFLAGHADWLEGVLDRAGGATVVTASHHNLVAHTEFSRDSFVMFGSDAMLKLLSDHGVRLHLSGHIHAQHIAQQSGVTDAALGAFCTWPHRYALLTLGDDGALTYEARSLDADLLPEGFLDESHAWFEDVNLDKLNAALADVEPADRAAMADFAARFNMAFFAGTYHSDDPAWTNDPAYRLWQAQDDNPFWQYMDQVMHEENGDNLYRRLD